MILWLLACKPAPELVPPPPPDLDDTATVADPAFPEPAEAEDLDPDPDVLHVTLTAAPHAYTVGDLAVDGYAYNGQVPGPTLRAKVGDRLVVDLVNDLPDPTTLHWHGLAVPWDMDGVTWQADPIGPGETFTYSFTLDRAGTYWYHPHFDSARQVDLGLYGVIVVEDPADPVPDREVVLVFDDWTEAGLRHAVDEAFPATWAVNGAVGPHLALSGGQLVRARLLNASNTRYLSLPSVRQIASDQGLLPAAREPEALVLAPGDRADLEWRIGQDGFALTTLPYSLSGGPALGEPLDLLEVEVVAPAAAPPSPSWPWDATPAATDPGTTDITYVFTGEGDDWLINGERYPDVTIESLALGQDAVIEVRNLSPTEHPFHLHGHAFEVLSGDGVRHLEDTVNVGIREALRVRMTADNPGDWMAHCHILPHAHGGMMTVLRVGP